MRLALRSLCWLILIAAVLVGWTVEHRLASVQIAQLGQNSFGRVQDDPDEVSEESKRRKAALIGLKRLSDDELTQQLNDVQDAAEADRGASHDLVLCEMASRQMADELQAAYTRMMTKKAHHEREDFPDNLKLLTALRRAQGKPDPLKIHVEFKHDDRGPEDAPLLVATLENVDVERQSVYLWQGCDYRSGRRTRWRVHLIDERGRQVPDANYTSWGMGGGLGTCGMLAFGEKGDQPSWLNARSYVRPRRTGRYQLRLVHTPDTIDLASEPDLSGLIVFQSDLIEVDVTVPPLPAAAISTTLLIGMLGFALLGAAVSIVSRQYFPNSSPTTGRGPLITWRDVLVLVFVAGLAVAWRVDLSSLSQRLQHLELDQDSGWTMRPAFEDS